MRRRGVSTFCKPPFFLAAQKNGPFFLENSSEEQMKYCIKMPSQKNGRMKTFHRSQRQES